MRKFNIALQMIWRFFYHKHGNSIPKVVPYIPWPNHLPIISEVDLRNVDLIPYVNPMREKLTVVLGMDRTLLHSSVLDPACDYKDFEFDFIVCDEKNTCRFGIHIRPMLRLFLKYGAKHFDLVLFTDAEKNYARPVMNLVDPNGYIKQRYYRDSCIFLNDVVIKPIQHLGRSMSRIVYVESSTVCMLTAPDNGIQVSSFFGDMTDKSVLQLMNILNHVQNLDDVRPFIIHTYHTRAHLVEIGFTPLDEPEGPFHSSC